MTIVFNKSILLLNENKIQFPDNYKYAVIYVNLSYRNTTESSPKYYGFLQLGYSYNVHADSVELNTDDYKQIISTSYSNVSIPNERTALILNTSYILDVSKNKELSFYIGQNTGGEVSMFNNSYIDIVCFGKES